MNPPSNGGPTQEQQAAALALASQVASQLEQLTPGPSPAAVMPGSKPKQQPLARSSAVSPRGGKPRGGGSTSGGGSSRRRASGPSSSASSEQLPSATTYDVDLPGWCARAPHPLAPPSFLQRAAPIQSPLSNPTCARLRHPTLPSEGPQPAVRRPLDGTPFTAAPAPAPTQARHPAEHEHGSHVQSLPRAQGRVCRVEAAGAVAALGAWPREHPTRLQVEAGARAPAATQ